MELNLTQILMNEAVREDWTEWMAAVRAALSRTDLKRPATWTGLETAAHAHGHMVRLTELLRKHCPKPDCRKPEEAGYLVLVAYHPDNRSTGYVTDALEAYVRTKDRDGVLLLCRVVSVIGTRGEYTHLNSVYNLLAGYLLRYRRERMKEYRKGAEPWLGEADLQDVGRYLPELEERSFADRVAAALPEAKSVEALARECGCALNTFERRFKEVFGETPRNWLAKQKARRIRSLLVGTDMTFREIASDCGFVSDNYFWDFCKKHLGDTPARIREAYRNTRKTYGGE